MYLPSYILINPLHLLKLFAPHKAPKTPHIFNSIGLLLVFYNC